MRGLPSEGARVIIPDIEDCRGLVEASEVEVLGVDYMVHKSDVADKASVQGTEESVTNRIGKIDISVNNVAFLAGLIWQLFEETLFKNGIKFLVST